MSDAILERQAGELSTLLPRLMRSIFLIYPGDTASELPGAQMRVCNVLREGPKSMSALSRELGISLSAITQMADRLEKAGMVERVVESEDRRVKTLQLTAHGREIMEKRQAWRSKCALCALRHLSPDERHNTLDAMHTLLQAANASRADFEPEEE